MAAIEDYSEPGVAQALSFLLELLDHLKAYRDYIVLAGGWAPYFLIRNSTPEGEQHIGSLDADLVLDHRSIPDSAYETINKLLERVGYSPRSDAQDRIVPASFQKIVPQHGGGKFRMQVDFLAGEYGGTARSHRHQKAQDMLAHKARGADIAFDQSYFENVPGRLPNQEKVTVRIKVANEVAVLTMKGITIGQRTKRKDFYDLYMLVKYFKDGPRSLAENVRPRLGNQLIQEAVANLGEHFEGLESLGPVSIIEFLRGRLSDTEARAVVQRDAFELIQALLGELRAR